MAQSRLLSPVVQLRPQGLAARWAPLRPLGLVGQSGLLGRWDHLLLPVPWARRQGQWLLPVLAAQWGQSGQSRRFDRLTLVGQPAPLGRLRPRGLAALSDPLRL